MGLMVELREIIETGRLVVVVMTRLVRFWVLVCGSPEGCIRLARIRKALELGRS
jgi:hypothetical protein